MNLIIDAGNTSLKLAVFKDNTLEYLKKTENTNAVKEISDIRVKFPEITDCIISSVSNVNKSELISATQGLKNINLNHKTQIPFINKYKTPTTLGVDRIALVAGSTIKHKNRNCLIIDAGTCITYDFKNGEETYLGGSIAPGLQLRYKSLPNYTANLPLLKPTFIDNLIGDTTEKAIHAGISNGIIAEIDGIIQEFSNTYPKLVVILTGGDAIFLSKRLKNGIFVDPNFLLHGLNYILEYNINK